MLKRPRRLPAEPNIDTRLKDRLEGDFDRFASDGLPADLEAYLLDEYDLDVSTTYAGLPVKNPWGKASGQLSMRSEQVADDVKAGLGFVVLKTVIAEDASGKQAMSAWAIRESQMVAERIRGQSGEEGWTISWKGRGWWQSFDAYLDLVRAARDLAAPHQTLIVPSCKYHLPTPDEQAWKQEEYRHTTARLLDAYLGESWAAPFARRRGTEVGLPNGGSVATDPLPVMPLEKDFSPTLAGSDRATVRQKILEWLRVVPRLVREAAEVRRDPSAMDADAGDNPQSPVRIGLKLFNALFDDEFQVAMLEAVHQAGDGRSDFLVYCNRLFDPDRRFGEHRGIAYGGPDLSDRNLRCLDAFLSSRRERSAPEPLLEISATGDIGSGKMAMEYALRGCSSFQLHTFFQLPSDQYVMRAGNKTQKALHLLSFHPQAGLVAWMHHVARQWGLEKERPIRFRDLVRLAREARP
jgi:hypothetical protein